MDIQDTIRIIEYNKNKEMKTIKQIQSKHNQSNEWNGDTVIGQSFNRIEYPGIDKLSKEYDGI